MEKKVLIIDDDPGMLELISSALKRKGFIVGTWASGDGAWETILKFKPDVLILDVMLPGVDGYAIGQRISRDPLTKNLPIVVVTAKEGVRSAFLELTQVVGFLVKPFDINELALIASQACYSPSMG